MLDQLDAKANPGPNVLQESPVATLPFEYVTEENAVWENMLANYVPQTGFEIKNPLEQDTRILDVGCGVAPEAHALSSAFGNEQFDDGFFKTVTKGVEFIGIDIDPALIEGAQRRHSVVDHSQYPPVRIPNPHQSFITGDATDLKRFVHGSFDIVVFAHPEVLHNSQKWKKVFAETAAIHNGGGLIIATVFTEAEMAAIRKELLPYYDIKVQEENKYRRTGYSIQPDRHRYIILGLRKIDTPISD